MRVHEDGEAGRRIGSLLTRLLRFLRRAQTNANKSAAERISPMLFFFSCVLHLRGITLSSAPPKETVLKTARDARTAGGRKRTKGNKAQCENSLLFFFF